MFPFHLIINTNQRFEKREKEGNQRAFTWWSVFDDLFLLGQGRGVGGSQDRFMGSPLSTNRVKVFFFFPFSSVFSPLLKSFIEMKVSQLC